MRQVLNYITWGLVILFAAPTIMIVVSWNSLPGDPLYGFKLGMEQILLVLVSPSYAAQGTLSVKYTERRFSDAKRLLADKGSVEGLAYLDKQVASTKNIIEKGNDVQTQKQLAQTYIDTLKDVAVQLEAEKQAIAAVPSTSSKPIVQRPSLVPPSPLTPIPTRPPYTFTQSAGSAQTSTPIPTRPPLPTPTPTPVPQQQNEQNTINQINQSQQTINDTIKQLENLAVQYQKEEHKQGEKTREQMKQNFPELQKEKGKGKN